MIHTLDAEATGNRIKQLRKERGYTVEELAELMSFYSGGFRTQDGADEYAVFHSITDTAKKNGKSRFGTLYLLITEEAPDATFIDKYIV